jgi:hypothetical protein
VNNIQQFDDSRTIVRDGDTLGIVNQFIHATRAKSGLEDFTNCLARVDVADQLWNTW